MSYNEQNIEDLFRREFDGAESMPPDNVWDKIEKKLDEAGVDKLFKEKFEDDSEEPPVGLWFKIQQRLFIKDFFQFNPSKINVYYTSLVAMLAGVGLYFAGSQPSTSNTKHQREKNDNISVIKANNQTLPKVHENTHITSNTVNSSIKNNSNSKNEDLSTNNKTTQYQHFNNSINQTLINASDVHIIGDSIICTSTEHEYVVAGIKNNTVKWSVSPKSTTIESTSGNTITISSTKVGIIELSAEYQNGNDKVTTSTQISVIEAQQPKITGNTKICEGTQQQYKLSNVQYINKQYIWNVSNNSFTVIHGGIITVAWELAGYDTIYVTDINTKTGCKINAALPVVVYPKPKADFKYTDNGNGVYEFINTSQCGQKATNCKQTAKWTIGEENKTGNNITIEFRENGTYNALLDVQNDFGCKESTKKELIVDIKNIFIPNAFAPGSENGIFIPIAENLTSYKIEIFNASNRKLWESNVLSDGKPAEGWDGMVAGQLQPKGTYFWRISATFEDGTKWKGVKQKGQYQTFGTFVLLEK